MQTKNIFISAMLLLAAVLPVQAETVTERECSTDSYGTVTCRDKTHNKETGEITYSDEVVVESRGTGTSESSSVTILSTGLPEVATPIAALIVTLGGVSFFLKKRL